MSFVITVVESSFDGRDTALVESIAHDDGRIEVTLMQRPSPIVPHKRYWGTTLVWRRELLAWGHGPLLCSVGG